MKFAHQDVLDGGLLAIKNGATKLLLISGYTPGDSYATVVAAKLAEATMTAADFTISSSGANRQVTSATKAVAASASSQVYDSGTATGGSTTTLANTGKSWVVNGYAGKAVAITGGTGAGQVGRIASNTGTVLTVAAAWATAPDTTSVYSISDDLHWAFTDGSAKVLWVTDETSNQAITSGNTVNLPALVYSSNQPT